MTHSITKMIRSFLLVSLGALAAYATTAGADHHSLPTKGELHRIDFPTIMPNPTIAENNCDAEAAAYIVAVNDMLAAQTAASDAYYAWMTCENTSRAENAAETDLASAPSHSVLVKGQEAR